MDERSSTEAWLAAFQARFGAMLRRPLDASSGTLTADVAGYERSLHPGTAGPERLAVYNRQYWFRLFGLMHGEYPLLTALCGPWMVNRWASTFFVGQPPRSADLGEAADGFAEFLERKSMDANIPCLPRDGAIPRDAVIEAARIDAAFRAVFSAPEQPTFRPTAEQTMRLPQSRLVPAAASSLIEEHWPLMELRRRLRAAASDAMVDLPPPHRGGPRWWALGRAPQGERVEPLHPLQGRLFALLRRHSVADALGRLEAACSANDRSVLVAQAQTWLAQSVALGLWVGVKTEEVP